MKKILDSKYGLLIFSLICGLGYFLLIMSLISSINYSYLLGLFFFPAIVCGGALCVYKTIRSFCDYGKFFALKNFININIVMVIFSIIFFIITLL